MVIHRVRVGTWLTFLVLRASVGFEPMVFFNGFWFCILYVVFQRLSLFVGRVHGVRSSFQLRGFPGQTICAVGFALGQPRVVASMRSKMKVFPAKAWIASFHGCIRGLPAQNAHMRVPCGFESCPLLFRDLRVPHKVSAARAGQAILPQGVALMA